MVNRQLGRAGKGSMGCLVTLFLLGMTVYLGLPVGQAFVRQYQFAEEMRSQARLAPSLSDAVIRRRILDRADELGLPAEATTNLRIRRTGGREGRITIESAYSETVDLKVLEHTFRFTPKADLPL